MTIRPATAADVSAVVSLVRKVEAYHQKSNPAKYLFRSDPGELYRAWLDRSAGDDRAVFLVCDAAGRGDPPAVVGFLIGTVEPEVRIYVLREYGWVHDLWIDEAYRHEGVGRQLVMQAVERFVDLGVRQIRLDVLADNEPARKLFEACGFRPSVVEMLVEVNGGVDPAAAWTPEEP